jgi:hypothetical protein
VVLKKTAKADGRLEQVRNALLVKGKGTFRSPLWRWMRENHDSLSALFEVASPAWASLAETFGGMGLTDREGKNPTAETARKTWYRVRRDMKRVRAAQRTGAVADDPPVTVAFTSSPATSPPPLLALAGPRTGDPVPQRRTIAEAPSARPVFDPEYREPGRPKFFGPARLRSRMPIQQEDE